MAKWLIEYLRKHCSKADILNQPESTDSIFIPTSCLRFAHYFVDQDLVSSEDLAVWGIRKSHSSIPLFRYMRCKNWHVKGSRAYFGDHLTDCSCNCGAIQKAVQLKFIPERIGIMYQNCWCSNKYGISTPASSTSSLWQQRSPCIDVIVVHNELSVCELQACGGILLQKLSTEHLRA